MADNTLNGSLPGDLSSTQTDASFTVVNSSDTSKKAKFSCSSISTATTRTFTFPDASTTITGTDASQTLTNKTINDGSNTLQWSYTTFASSSWTTPIFSKSYTFYIHKMGQIVNLSFPTVTGTTNSTNGFSIVGALSAAYRPVFQQEIPLRIRNTNFGVGLLIIQTNGDINFYTDMAGNIWPSGGVAFEIRGISVQYTVSLP